MKKFFAVVAGCFIFGSIYGTSCTCIEPGDLPEREQVGDVNVTLEFSDAGEKVVDEVVDSGEVVATEMMDGSMVEPQPNDQVISETQPEPTVDVADSSVQPEPVAEVMQQEVMPEPQPTETTPTDNWKCTKKVGTCGAKPTNMCDLTQWKFVIRVPDNWLDTEWFHDVQSWPIGPKESWSQETSKGVLWSPPYWNGKPINHFSVIVRRTNFDDFHLAHNVSEMCHEHPCIKPCASPGKYTDETSVKGTNSYSQVCHKTPVTVTKDTNTTIYCVDLGCLNKSGCTY